MIYRIVLKNNIIGISDPEYYVDTDLSKAKVEECAKEFEKLLDEMHLDPNVACIKAFPTNTKLVEVQTINIYD